MRTSGSIRDLIIGDIRELLQDLHNIQGDIDHLEYKIKSYRPSVERVQRATAALARGEKVKVFTLKSDRFVADRLRWCEKRVHSLELKQYWVVAHIVQKVGAFLDYNWGPLREGKSVAFGKVVAEASVGVNLKGCIPSRRLLPAKRHLGSEL